MKNIELGANADAAMSAGVEANPDAIHLGVHMRTRYEVECYDKDGNLRWREEFENLVTTVGKNKLLTNLLSGGSGATQYVGLKGTGTALAADTMASHASWLELGGAQPAFSESARQAFVPGAVAAGSVDNTASKAVFTIDATVTIYGAFLVDSSTLDGTTGTLYGVGDFASSRSVFSGDTVNVALTLTA